MPARSIVDTAQTNRPDGVRQIRSGPRIRMAADPVIRLFQRIDEAQCSLGRVLAQVVSNGLVDILLGT